MRYEQTYDLELIRREIAFDPRVWRASIDDSGPEWREWRPIDDPRVIYVVAIDAGSAVATYTLIPQNAICYELHASRVFGRAQAEALRGVFAWSFRHTPARRIVASIPRDNPIAIRAARRAGMEQYGVNPRSFLRGGTLQDQILFGVSE